MASKTLLLAAAVAVTFTGSATAGTGSANSGQVSVCHRTGPKTGPIARGHVITFSANALDAHVNHGDVLLAPVTVQVLGENGACGINAAKEVLDSEGNLIQPVAPPAPVAKPKTGTSPAPEAGGPG